MQKRCIRHGPGTALARASAQNHSLLRRKPQSVTHRKLACAQAAVAPEEISHAQLVNNLFEDLCSHCQIKTHVKVGDSSTGGIGLFATQPCAKGDTIIRVPRSLCIVIDNETGSLSIPQGQWPRLSGGIVQEGEPLTWDVLQGLALMDATAGDGDPFWELYCDHFMQQPEQLTLPMCWDPELLQQLQHTAIIEAAQKQQERLRTILPPEYMQPIGPGLPSYLQWGFACVRSRALQLGAQAFGMVPFVDLANHAADPNADTRVVPAAAAAATGATSSSGGGSDSPQTPEASQGFVELVAVKDIPAGAEVTISYSGLAGFTNQRLMAQYGFVPQQGNTADRLELQIPEGLQGSTFRLSYLEDALGSQLLMQAAQGNNPYLIAALKSLPITADDVDPAAAAEVDGSDSTSKGRGIGPATQQEKQLARALLQQVDAEVAACGSSLQEDEQLLQQLRQQQQQTMRGGAAEGSVDVRRIAAVRYRIERKRLLQACQVLLNIFLRE